MLTSNRKQTLYLFREIILNLIDIYNENTEAYFYILNHDIVYISTVRVEIFKEIKIGKMSLIRLFIHTLVEEYPQIQVANLVLIAYRIVRRCSINQIAILINCTSEQYQKLESGFYLFENKYSFEKLSKKLNIPKEFFISNLHFAPHRFLE